MNLFHLHSWFEELEAPLRSVLAGEVEVAASITGVSMIGISDGTSIFGFGASNSTIGVLIGSV